MRKKYVDCFKLYKKYTPAIYVASGRAFNSHCSLNIFFYFFFLRKKNAKKIRGPFSAIFKYEQKSTHLQST